MKGRSELLRILQADCTDEERLQAVTRLCRHRGEMIDADEELIQSQRVLLANDKCIIHNQNELIKILQGIPIWTRLVVCINNWAKS